MSTLTITLKLNLPDGVTLDGIDASVDEESLAEPVALSGALASSVADRIGTAPGRYHDLLTELAERCRTELGCAVEVPDGKREDYLNIYGPGRKRFRPGGFMVRESTVRRGPRMEIYCDPKHAATHPPAEENLHNGHPVSVKVYLADEGALDVAIGLMKIALEEHAD